MRLCIVFTAINSCAHSLFIPFPFSMNSVFNDTFPVLVSTYKLLFFFICFAFLTVSLSSSLGFNDSFVGVERDRRVIFLRSVEAEKR